MSLITERKRIRNADELESYKARVSALFGELDSIKQNLTGIKSRFQTDPTFTPADIAEVDAVIELVKTRFSDA